MLHYTYIPSGQKITQQLIDEDGRVSTRRDYAGSFVYVNNELAWVNTPHGRMVNKNHGGKEMEEYVLEFHLRDHLGNTRATYQSGILTSQTDYYPFGLTFYSGGRSGTSTLTQNRYLYNGKEYQDDFGLNWYDYGARFYDAQIGRWHSVDPLAEKNSDRSVYHFTSNNPINRIDPDGMDDYKLNRETGAMELIKETEDETDRVVKTYKFGKRKGEVRYNRKGEAKTAIADVEKGILSDGINFQENDNIIEVGGEGQPSVDGVKSFTLQLSEYVGKEIKGFSYSADGSENVTDMLLGKYKGNTYTTSKGTPAELLRKYGVDNTLKNIVQEFHTHPGGKLGATESAPKLSKDVQNLQRDKPRMPNASFIILYRIAGQVKPGEYPYTHHYKP